MHEGTITVRLSTKNQSNKLLKQGLSPLTWVSEHWPWATRTREKSITLAASKAIGGIISNSTRFVPNGTAARKNRGGTSNSRKSISASSERKRNKQQDCLHKASHLVAGKLVERTVVIGDLSQQQMVRKKQESETPKEKRKRRIRNRMVYNDWGLYGFVQMLAYKCLRFGKELSIISERDTTKMCHACKHKQDMPLWQRTYRCSNENCGLVMDRDENSAVNIRERFLARLGPHT